MVLLLTVTAGGGRRSVRLSELVGVARRPLPSSPPTPPTYLACRPKKRAGRGEMEVLNSAVRGGGRSKGAVSREAMKSSRLFFACAWELAPSPWSHERVQTLTTFGNWEREREREEVGSTEDALTHVLATTQWQPNHPMSLFSAL
jgi:hypothetical protein